VNVDLKADLKTDLKAACRLALSLLLVGLTQLAWAQNESAAAGGTLFDRYPGGGIKTVAVADAALIEVSHERERVDTEWIRQQRNCYKKFFVSSCLDKAKAAHRAQSKKIKDVEIEANTYLRQARADDRDAALAEQRAQDLADAPLRAEEQKKNAAANAQKVEESARRSADADARAQSATLTPDQRIAEHNQKMQQVRAEQEAVAKAHDANVAAYQKKAKDAQERQKEVAAKKAEKAAQRAAAQK
jgi:hypothetical protein